LVRGVGNHHVEQKSTVATTEAGGDSKEDDNKEIFCPENGDAPPVDSSPSRKDTRFRVMQYK
jgi:hypothetical protein